MDKKTMLVGLEIKLKSEVIPYDLRSALKALKLLRVDDFTEEDLDVIAKMIDFRRKNMGRKFNVSAKQLIKRERADAVAHKKAQPTVRDDGMVYGGRMVEYFEDKYGYSPSISWIRGLYKGFTTSSYYDPSIAISRTQDLADLRLAQGIKSGIRAVDRAPTGYVWGDNIEGQPGLPVSTIKSRLTANGVASRKYSLVKEVDLDLACTLIPRTAPLTLKDGWDGLRPVKEVRAQFYRLYESKGIKLDYVIWRSACLSVFKTWAATPAEITQSQAQEILAQIAKRFVS